MSDVCACYACKGLCDEPKTLACGDTICGGCVDKLVEEGSAGAGRRGEVHIRCPICHHHTPVPHSGLPTNHTMQVLFGMVKAYELERRQGGRNRGRASSEASFPSSPAGEGSLPDTESEEAALARENFKDFPLPDFPGFQVSLDQAEVKLSKTRGDAQICITLNVKNSAKYEKTENPIDGREQPLSPRLQGNYTIVSRPAFLVEIETGGKKLCFDCQITGPGQYPPDQGDQPAWQFRVKGWYVSEGGELDKAYSASSSRLSERLNGAFMKMLAEWGLDAQFGERLVQMATHHEHSLFVSELRKFKDLSSLLDTHTA